MMARATHQATTAQEAPPTPDNVCWAWRKDRADDGATWTAYRADDVGSELAPPVAHPDGSWRTEGIVARPGVLIYREGGREIRELVPDEVLHDEEHLRLLRDVVVTLEHPSQMVNPTNQEQLNAGNLGGEVRKLSDGSIAAPIILRRADLLDAVKSRLKTELSEGYRAEISNTPGTHPQYGEYDRVQVKRIPNHVAVTGRARGGRTLAIRLDASGDCEPMLIASVSHPQPGGAPRIAKETPVKTASQLALEFIMAQAGGLRLDAMSEEEAAAKAMEIVQGASNIDVRIGKALGQAATLDELRSHAASLEKALNKVRGDLTMAEAEKARLTQEGAAMKTEMDTMKADMAKVVEPEAAVAQAMDGMMPADDKPRLDSARAQSLNSMIMRSLAQRQRAADLISAKRLDTKELGIDVMSDPIAKVNKAIAARFDSEYAKADANPAEIEAVLKIQHAALKNESATRNDSATGAAKGYDFLRFNGNASQERRDSAGGGQAVKASNIPLGSCLTETRPS